MPDKRNPPGLYYLVRTCPVAPPFAKQRRHPGAAHYLIHSYDDQIHAPLGLRAARAYNKIAPSATHRKHALSWLQYALLQQGRVEEAAAKVLSVAEGLHEDDSATSEGGHNIATIIAREPQATRLHRKPEEYWKATGRLW